MICNAHHDTTAAIRTCPACDADALRELTREQSRVIADQAREIETMRKALDRANRVPEAWGTEAKERKTA